MSRSLLRASALLMGLGLGLAACQTTGRIDPGRLLDPADPLPRALLRDLVEHNAQRDGLRASARLSVRGPQVRFSRPQRIVAQRPEQLRIEVIGLFGQVAALLVTDGREFGFVDLLSGVRERGPVDADLLWRTAHVDLTPSEAVELLLAVPGFDAAAGITQARRYADGRIAMRLRGADAPRERLLVLDAAGRPIHVELADADGARLWVARYRDWREIGGERFAYELVLEFPRVETEVTVLFDAVELDPQLSPDVFVLQVAAGE